MAHRALAAASFVALVALLAAGCGSDAAPTDGTDRIEVVATIFPLADVVREIGGERVSVACLLAAGESPHDFQPTARDAERLAQADLLVMVGLGVDEWAARAAGAMSGQGQAVLALGEDPELVERLEAPATRPAATGAADAHEHEHGHDSPAGDEHDHARGHDHAHAHGGLTDPHVWLDPVFMKHFVRRIAARLIEIDPDHAAAYERNRDAYLARLDDLDAEYRRRLADVDRRVFVTYHAAFTYIARRYGLEAESLHSPDAGGFGAGRLERMAEFIRDHDVQAIFVEPQFPRERLDALAERTGVAAGTLDPLGDPNRPAYDGYIAMMRSNLDALVEALDR